MDNIEEDSGLFSLAPVFTDNMVLQSNSQIRIWGTAPSRQPVKLEISDSRNKDIDNIIKTNYCAESNEKGVWQMKIGSLKAGGPYELTVTCGREQKVLKNVLAGEVWIAGGQSNMEFPLFFSSHADEEIPASNYPEIRFYTSPRRPFEGAVIKGYHFEPTLSEDACWQICTSGTAPHFSAVAYYFAKELYLKLKVPVGIISCNWGATSAEVWMDEKYLEADLELSPIINDYRKLERELDAKRYEDDFQAYLDKISVVCKIGNETVRQSQKPVIPVPLPPMGPKSFKRPCGLYHTMLSKLKPLTIKGVIWYQGESNAEQAELYKKIFPAMIRNWRSDFENNELPFLFVQLAPTNNRNSQNELREAQLYTLKTTSNTAMVVTTDCGDIGNCHPFNKKVIGERLAAAARAVAYNEEIEYSGPIFKDIDIVKSGKTSRQDNHDDMSLEGQFDTERYKIVIKFSHVGKGLIFKGGKACGFEICGDDGAFMAPERWTGLDECISNDIAFKCSSSSGSNIYINGDAVEIYVDNPEKIRCIRYGWTDFAMLNLYNADGYPASPFRAKI